MSSLKEQIQIQIENWVSVNEQQENQIIELKNQLKLMCDKFEEMKINYYDVIKKYDDLEFKYHSKSSKYTEIKSKYEFINDQIEILSKIIEDTQLAKNNSQELVNNLNKKFDGKIIEFNNHLSKFNELECKYYEYKRNNGVKLEKYKKKLKIYMNRNKRIKKRENMLKIDATQLWTHLNDIGSNIWTLYNSMNTLIIENTKIKSQIENKNKIILHNKILIEKNDENLIKMQEILKKQDKQNFASLSDFKYLILAFEKHNIKSEDDYLKRKNLNKNLLSAIKVKNEIILKYSHKIKKLKNETINILFNFSEINEVIRDLRKSNLNFINNKNSTIVNNSVFSDTLNQIRNCAKNLFDFFPKIQLNQKIERNTSIPFLIISFQKQNKYFEENDMWELNSKLNAIEDIFKLMAEDIASFSTKYQNKKYKNSVLKKDAILKSETLQNINEAIKAKEQCINDFSREIEEKNLMIEQINSQLKQTENNYILAISKKDREILDITNKNIDITNGYLEHQSQAKEENKTFQNKIAFLENELVKTKLQINIVTEKISATVKKTEKTPCRVKKLMNKNENFLYIENSIPISSTPCKKDSKIFVPNTPLSMIPTKNNKPRKNCQKDSE
ncbi:hypothetical protein HZS_3910, partial [Henneguya salminicola]